jgi:hypothetical protein
VATFLLISFAAGFVLAIPIWIVRQRVSGTRRGLRLARGLLPRDTVPCEIEAVVLSGRLLVRPKKNDIEAQS